MPEIERSGSNPLQKYFRQPKIYIGLPSKGNWYPDGSIEKTETGEYPIYAMTARDELMFKTPDALFTGRATADVIKSCIPTILDPWKLVGYDIDIL